MRYDAQTPTQKCFCFGCFRHLLLSFFFFALKLKEKNRRRKNGGSSEGMFHVRRRWLPGKALPLLQVPPTLPTLVSNCQNF